MKITVEGEPKEIAALVLAVQERQIVGADAVVQRLMDGFSAAL